MTRDGARSRLLLNLALLVTAGVLAAAVYWSVQRDEEMESVRLTELDPATVHHITIHRAEGPDIEITKVDDHWHLDAPFDMPASAYRSAQIAGLLGETSHAHYDASELDLTRYGLVPPRATISLDDTVIELGDINPVNNFRYVLVGGQVHLVSDTLYDALEGEATNFIDTRLLPEGASIDHIALPQASLTKQPDGGWTVSPERPDVSADDIQRVVDEWQRTNALWVKPYDQTPATANVTIGLASGETLDFAVTRTEPDLVLARPNLGIQYRLVSDKGPALLELKPKDEPADGKDLSPPQ